MTDPIARTFWTAATAYIGAGKPTVELTHALVDAFLRLIAARSGVKVRMVIGDGVITRNPDERQLLQRN